MMCLIGIVILTAATVVLDGIHYHQTMQLRELCNLPPRMDALSKEHAIARIEEEQLRIRLRITIDVSTLMLALLVIWGANRDSREH